MPGNSISFLPCLSCLYAAISAWFLICDRLAVVLKLRYIYQITSRKVLSIDRELDFDGSRIPAVNYRLKDISKRA